MIIGIDASRANRGHKSGTEWYSYFLIRHFARLDPANQYVLYSDKPLHGGLLDLTTPNDSDIDTGASADYDREGYQVLTSPHGNFRGKVLSWPYDYFWTLGRLTLEMLRRPPDVLFVPAHTLPLWNPTRSVVTIHDIGFERDHRYYGRESMGPRGKRRRRLFNALVKIYTLGKYQADAIDYLRWSTKFSMKHASEVITVSDFTKAELIDFYRADAGKIMTVHNGYDETHYHPVTDAIATQAVLDKYGIERPYIFYIGRIERKKNIPALIEAFAIMRDSHPELKHRLLLVGDASYGYDETKYSIREFDLVREVIMPGWVEEADIPFLYAAADAFVFPSSYEGFGIPLLQAMACGVPIAASNAASIPEVAGEAALYFNPDVSYSMADALGRVLTDRRLRDQLVKNGLDRVKQFGWERCARETLAVLTRNPKL